MYPGREELVGRLRQAAAEQRQPLTELGRRLYAHPEPPGQEAIAAQLVAEFLAARGFELELEPGGVPAAVRARYYHWDTEAMRNGLRHAHIGFLADLSAAPEGHIWGHQLTTVAALTAAVALAQTMPPEVFGTVSVFACPGPNTGGGKLRLAEAGVFEDLDQLYGVQPALSGLGFSPITDSSGRTLAQAVVSIRYPDDAAAALGELQAAVAHVFGDLEPLESITPTPDGFVIEALTAQAARARYEQLAALAEARGRSGGPVPRVELTSFVHDMNANRITARRVKTFAHSEGLPADRFVKLPAGPPADWGSISYATATLRWPYPITSEQVDAYGSEFAELSNRDEAYARTLHAGAILATLSLDAMVDIDFRGYIENEFIYGLKQRGAARVHRRWTGVHPVQPPSGGARYVQPKPGVSPAAEPSGES
jgi:hypothetical protein